MNETLFCDIRHEPLIADSQNLMINSGALRRIGTFGLKLPKPGYLYMNESMIFLLYTN